MKIKRNNPEKLRKSCNLNVSRQVALTISCLRIKKIHSSFFAGLRLPCYTRSGESRRMSNDVREKEANDRRSGSTCNPGFSRYPGS